jgi:hypothetical protein
MKVDVRLSLDSETYFEIGKFARQEGIDERQAIRWLLTEGIKSFNGLNGQTRLQATRLSEAGGKEERAD